MIPAEKHQQFPSWELLFLESPSSKATMLASKSPLGLPVEVRVSILGYLETRELQAAILTGHVSCDVLPGRSSRHPRQSPCRHPAISPEVQRDAVSAMRLLVSLLTASAKSMHISHVAMQCWMG
jgi:hypothetical protein